MSTKLSTDEVKHIAELAKLGLTDAETELFREQLSDILEYAEMLQRLDTDGISPTASVGSLGTVMRADIVTPSLAQEAEGLSPSSSLLLGQDAPFCASLL